MLVIIVIAVLVVGIKRIITRYLITSTCSIVAPTLSYVEMVVKLMCITQYL